MSLRVLVILVIARHREDHPATPGLDLGQSSQHNVGSNVHLRAVEDAAESLSGLREGAERNAAGKGGRERRRRGRGGYGSRLAEADDFRFVGVGRELVGVAGGKGGGERDQRQCSLTGGPSSQLEQVGHAVAFR